MLTRFRLPARFRNTFVYLGTMFGMQLGSFLLLPIITRFLEPSRYGEYAVGLAVGTLIGMFASAWMRNVGFRFYFDAKAAGSTRSFFWSVAAFQAVVVAVVFAGAIAVLGTIGSSILTLPTLLALAAMTLVSDLLSWAVALVRAEQLSGRFAVAELSSVAARLVGTIAGLMLGLRSPAFLFLAATAASGVGALAAVLALEPRLQGRLSLALDTLADIGRRGPSALPFSLGEWLNRLSDRLILTFLSTTAVVGVYSAGQTLGDRLVSGLVQAVFMMAWPDVLNAWNEGGIARAREAVRRYIQIFLTLTVGPLVALVLYADTLVHLLGPSYQDAVHVVAIIGVATWARGLGSCFNRHLELGKRYARLSAVTLAGAALNVALTFLLVPRLLGVGAALATLVAQSLVALVFVLTRDRELVAFPTADALYVAVAVAVPGLLAWPLLGNSLAGLALFAVGYALIMTGVWVRRIRFSAASSHP